MNNKGFAITTMLYGLSIMGFLIVVLLMGIMANNRHNTKELVSTIEEELDRYSTTSTTLEENGEFVVRPGESGIYKLELWGKNYRALTVYLEENTTLTFKKSASGTSNIKSELILYLKAGDASSTKQVIAQTDNDTPDGKYCRIAGGIPNGATEYQQTTKELDEHGVAKKVTVRLTGSYSNPSSSLSYGNNQCISNINAAGKFSVKQLVKIPKTTAFAYPSDFASGSLAVNYYLMTIDAGGSSGDDGDYKSNVALTLDPTGNVKFSTFEGNKYQAWNIKRVGTGASSYFHITNSATGAALECNTETINNMDMVDDVIAKNRLNDTNKYMQWKSGDATSPFENCGNGTYNCLILNPQNLTSPAGYLKATGANLATFVDSKTKETKLYIQNAE